MIKIKITNKVHYQLWLVILSFIILLGIYSLIFSLVFTPEIFEFSLKIIWSLMVSNYIFFVVSGTGLCMITSLGHIFGIKKYEQISKFGLYLAILTILFGMMSIGFHLGRPDRLIYNILTPNPASAIWWMGTLYSFYLIFLLVEFWCLIRQDLLKIAETKGGFKKRFYEMLALKGLWHKLITYLPSLTEHQISKIVGVLALITGMSATSTLGAVFGHTESRIFWYGGFYPAYMLISAFFSGLACLLGTIILIHKILNIVIENSFKRLILELSQILTLFLGLNMCLVSLKLWFGLDNTIEIMTIEILLTGPFKYSFWIFEILLGNIIPITILLYSIRKELLSGVMYVSFFILIGIFLSRYNFLTLGQIYPLFNPLGKSPLEIIPSFFPTIFEIFLILGLFGGFLFCLSIGLKYLPIIDKYKSQ